MKLMLIAAIAASTLAVSAADANKEQDKSASAPVVMEEKDDPALAFWGFGSSGVYSGYQLYGSLLNSEPVWQTYLEGNVSINIADIDFGYLGIGFWCNTDLTGKRHNSYGTFMNETDPNIHWGKTFWFDENKTWGLDYRATVIWFYYPHHMWQKNKTSPKTNTTMDFDHSFALINPYVIPFFTWVHEYHENNSDLWEFGLKRQFSICDGLTVTPSVTGVIRDHRYNWCFATAGFKHFHNGGWATLKYMLEANYQFCDNFGLFAKVAFCQTVDGSLRNEAEIGSGADYGQYKDFVWGGVGLSFNF